IPIRKSTDDIASQNATANLGIDKEITITKKRQPTAKLDISRLLSPAGIPKLRKISKDRLKFRGKGHEFTDVARLLNTYQLWLDDLYPRAKFADGLLMIEKLGHSKQLQIMRKQWIDE
ncbi:Swi3-domain-containing protein, partial [Patellaria atrata CBS 101060]